MTQKDLKFGDILEYPSNVGLLSYPLYVDWFLWSFTGIFQVPPASRRARLS